MRQIVLSTNGVVLYPPQTFQLQGVGLVQVGLVQFREQFAICSSATSITSCGVALATGKRAYVDFDVPESEDPDGSLRLHRIAGLISAQSTPLISRSGKRIGIVSTHWRNHHRPSDRELRFLDLLARQAADLIEQRQTTAEREQLLAREQAAREEADRANRIKDEFLAVLSHELRSPLNPILGWTRLLQSGKLDAARQQEALATIERNAKLQTQLIEDLLDISCIMRGNLSLTVAPVSYLPLSTPLAGIQVLLVDDEPDTREFQAFLLEQNGARVTAVASGLEALQALEQSIPDVLVSDIGMADMDGYMLLQQIRSRPFEQGGMIPAVALTAYATEIDQRRAIQMGVVPFRKG
jgi:CheY-like chemotaxis protein